MQLIYLLLLLSFFRRPDFSPCGTFCLLPAGFNLNFNKQFLNDNIKPNIKAPHVSPHKRWFLYIKE